MIVRPVLQSPLTHCAALLCGLAVMWHSRDPESAVSDQAFSPALRSSRHRASAAPRLSSAAEYHEVRRMIESGTVPPENRADLMEKLFDEWAGRDPAGLLDYLAGCCGWPKTNLRGTFFQIAKSRPDLLLDFARKTGCDHALTAFHSGADNNTVIGLIQAIPEQERGAGLVRMLGSIRESMERVAVEKKDKAPRALARAALVDNDMDAFFKHLNEIQCSSTRSELADLMVEGRADGMDDATLISLIKRLPEECRSRAVSGVWFGPEEYPEARAATRRWIQQLAANGFGDEAAHRTSSLISDETTRIDELADWVSTLPVNETTVEFHKSLFSDWAHRDFPSAVRGLARLPAGGVRDRLIVQQIQDILLNPEHRPASDTDALVPLFTDPALADRMKKWVKSGDPFDEPPEGPLEDPFGDPDPSDPGDPCDPFAE